VTAAALVDTAVFAYALGGEHRLKAPCVKLVAAAGAGTLEFHASVEMVQELLFHRMRRTDRGSAIAQAQDAAILCTLYEFDRSVLDRSLDLVRRLPDLGGRDAVHAATAVVHGIGVIISPDRAFDGIPALRRVSPDDAAQGVEAIPSGPPRNAGSELPPAGW
jgi:uncharacterized protein